MTLTTFENVSFKQVSNVPNAGTMACALQSFCKSLCFAMGKDLPTRAIHARRHPETRLGGLADSAFWNCTIYKGSGWIIVNYVRHVTANWCLICFIISYVFLHVYSVIIWCTWIPILKHYSCPEQWDWRIWSPSAIEIAVFYGHDMLSQGVWWLMSRSMINVNVIIIRTSPQYDPTWHTKVCVFGVKRHVSSRCSMNCGLLKGDKKMFHACAMKSVLKHRNILWHHNLNMLCLWTTWRGNMGNVMWGPHGASGLRGCGLGNGGHNRDWVLYMVVRQYFQWNIRSV